MTKRNVNDAFVIWGGYGGHNLGDEAILWAVTLQLRRVHPSAKLFVIVRGPVAAEVQEQYRRWGVVPVQFRSLKGLNTLRRARLIVGGGQLLDDTLSLWPVGYTSVVLIVNFLSRRRPLILCIGAEVIKRKITALVARRTYGLASAITLRDAASLEAVRRLGIPAAKLRPTRDVVFSLTADKLPRRSRSSSGKGHIVVVLSHDPQRTPGKADFFSVLVKEVAATGFEVSVIGHDLRMAYDYGLLLELEQEFKADTRVAVERLSLVDEVLRHYANADAVISSRMHPLILASLAGTLPIAIEGTAKVSSLIATLKLPSISRTEEPASRQTKLAAAISNRNEYLSHIQQMTAAFTPEVEESIAVALGG